MKKLIVILTIAVAACTDHIKTDQQSNDSSHEKENIETGLQLNNGNKWKADETTKKNVAAMLELVNAGIYADKGKRKELYTNLQTKIDLLVKECSMKGEEHEVLHIWLRKILKDMKELKEEGDDYLSVCEVLKKDIESFSSFFE